MKKLLPIVIFIVVFSGIIVQQMVFDLFNTQAKLTPQEKTTYSRISYILDHLTLKIPAGPSIKLNKVKSHIIILNFWASWCKPCIKELTTLAEIYKTYNSDQVQIFSINIDSKDQKQAVMKIAKKYKLDFNIILDPKGYILDKFQLPSIPSSIIFAKGKPLSIFVGPESFDKEKIKRLIGAR